MILMMVVLKLGRGGKQAPIADWASLLGVPETVLGPHLRRLAKAGLLGVVSVAGKEAGKGRGRPRVEYSWSEGHADRAAGESSDEAGGNGLDGLVRSLVQGAGTYTRKPAPRKGEDGKLVAPSRKGAGSRLNLGNRLVLATLLAFADRYGVVRGKGLSDLAATIGMTVPRLESHLAKLVGLGHIRAYVPGGSCSPLAGVVPGAYFLNLGHPQFGAEALPGLAYALATRRPPLEYQDRKSGDMSRLIGAARQAASKPPAQISRTAFAGYFHRLAPVTDEVALRLAAILTVAGKQKIDGLLQAILEKHASRVLTEHADTPRIAQLEWVMGEVRKEVLDDIYPPRRRNQRLDDEATVAAIEHLASFMATRVLDIADYCQQEIRRFTLPVVLRPYASRKPDGYVILPWINTSNSVFMVVVATYPRLEGGLNQSGFLLPKNNYFVMGDNGGDLKIDFDVELVGEPPFDSRVYSNGLFIRPAKLPLKVSSKKKVVFSSRGGPSTRK